MSGLRHHDRARSRGEQGSTVPMSGEQGSTVPMSGEQGSTVPLIVVLLIVAISFVAVAGGATALHLERLRLLTVADGAALAGAESFGVADVRVEGDSVLPTLSADRASAAAESYLADADRTHFDGLTLVAAGTADGRTATVTISSTWHPPILNTLLPVAIPVTVTSTAAARFR